MKKNENIHEDLSPDQAPPPLTKWQKRRRIAILLAGLIGFNLFVWGTLYYSFVSTSSDVQSNKEKVNEENKLSNLFHVKKGEPSPTVTPEDVPFKELTIPYLRIREYESNLGELNLVSENASYTSYLTSYDSDGFNVNGQLTIPKGERPEAGWPAIIFIHGYIPPQNYQTLSNYSDYVDYFARSGYVVFKIDLRGHGESEGEANGAYFSGDYIIDVLSARAALQNSDFVNSNKVGLWGHSMGGNVVSRSLAAAPDIPAVVIWAGAVYTYEDFYDFQIQDSSYQPPTDDSERRRKRSELFGIHGTFNKDSEFWKKVPMTNYLSDIKGAISIHHAQNDNVVNIEYSRNLNKILDGTSIEHELIEYQAGGHNLSGFTFNQAMQNSVKFFDQHLK